MPCVFTPKTPAPPLSLASLVAPLGVERFLSEYWGKRPLFVKSAVPDRFASLFSFDKFERAMRKLPVYATFNDYGNSRASRFNINNEILLHEDQIDCVRAMTDVTLTVGNLQMTDPTICTILAGLKEELAHGGGITCNAWLSSPEAGLPIHFDEATSFMLQIAGQKHWRCSTRPVIEYPAKQGLLGSDNRVKYYNFNSKGIHNVDAWMTQAPTTNTEEFIEFTMEPGDVCFMPAGVWHTTRATASGASGNQASLGLNFRMSHISMWHLISSALREDLLRDPNWRHLPPSEGSKREVLEHMLDALRNRIAAISVDSLDLELRWLKHIAAFNGPAATSQVTLTPQSYLRVATSRPVVKYVQDLEAGPISFVAERGTVKFFEKRVLPFARKLLSAETFRAGDALAWFSSHFEWIELKSILQLLLTAGVIECVEDT